MKKEGEADTYIRQAMRKLDALGTPAKAKTSAWFFKTGVGQYGAGDVFIGITVPEQRVVAKECAANLIKIYVESGNKVFHGPQILKLLSNKIHEYRLTALLVLDYLYSNKKSDDSLKKQIFDFYISNLAYVNNWDLVDSSARDIVGAYLYQFKKSNTERLKILKAWTISENLWVRRIAIVSTHYFINKSEFELTLKISEMLLKDKHDLIHKAVGWMLREMGKKDQEVLCRFLDSHAGTMPRTALRYALERLPEKKRAYYMGLAKVLLLGTDTSIKGVIVSRKTGQNAK